MLTLFILCLVTEFVFIKPAYSRLMYITIKLYVYSYMFRRNSAIFRESINQITTVYYGLLFMHYTLVCFKYLCVDSTEDSGVPPKRVAVKKAFITVFIKYEYFGVINEMLQR